MSNKIKKITWKEFDIRCLNMSKIILKNKAIKNIYGICRGGWPIAVKLSHITGLPITQKPNQKNTAIVDDILDSGATRKAFGKFPYFYTLTTKTQEEKEEGIWYVFPWESK